MPKKDLIAKKDLKNLNIQFTPKISKILPKKEFHVPRHFSVSSIGTFLTCRRKCWYSRIRRLVPKLSPDYFYIGRVWHEALDVLYSWQSYDAALRQIKRSIKKESKSPWFTADQFERIKTDRTILSAMLNGYYQVYGKEDFKKWRILRGEIEFNLPDFLNSGFDFNGRMDSALKIATGPHRGTWCLENKTASQISNYQLEQVKIDPQILGYVSACGHILGKKPRGVIWNVIRKPSIRQKKAQTLTAYRKELEQDYIDRPSFYYNREYLFVPTKAVEEWEEEITNVLLDFELACQQPEDKHIWYKNPSMCTMYGRCAYLSLCSRGEKIQTLSMFRIHTRDEETEKKGNKDGKRKTEKKRKEIIDKRKTRQTRKHYSGI